MLGDPVGQLDTYDEVMIEEHIEAAVFSEGLATETEQMSIGTFNQDWRQRTS